MLFPRALRCPGLETENRLAFLHHVEPIASDARVLARYVDKDGWLDGKPAIVTRKVGRGSITYVGAWLDPAAMAQLDALEEGLATAWDPAGAP